MNSHPCVQTAFITPLEARCGEASYRCGCCGGGRAAHHADTSISDAKEDAEGIVGDTWVVR